MYLSYYDLKEKPFQISTDPKFLWLGEKHEEALSTLKYGLLADSGFVLLTGDVGTGKTTIINTLINDLAEDIILATVSNPSLEQLEFFNLISYSFGLKSRFTSKGDFLIVFTEFLFENHSRGKKVLLVIDEAQRLDQELLEEIRLLSNIEKQDRKLLNIIFAGQNEFNDILLLDQNRALRQRITINYHIDPLTADETGEYIRHRLGVAGSERNIFSSNAIPAIFLFSNGYPRLINIICDHALLTGYIKYLETIDADIIKECADELQIKGDSRSNSEITQEKGPRGEHKKGRRLFGWPLVSVIIVILLILLGYFFFTRGYGQRLIPDKKNRMRNSSTVIDPASDNYSETRQAKKPVDRIVPTEDPGYIVRQKIIQEKRFESSPE